jgi:predicted metal-dependent enzyme (double-stranded beta helix superfamily)
MAEAVVATVLNKSGAPIHVTQADLPGHPQFTWECTGCGNPRDPWMTMRPSVTDSAQRHAKTCTFLPQET